MKTVRMPNFNFTRILNFCFVSFLFSTLEFSLYFLFWFIPKFPIDFENKKNSQSFSLRALSLDCAKHTSLQVICSIQTDLVCLLCRKVVPLQICWYFTETYAHNTRPNHNMCLSVPREERGRMK